MGIGLWVLIASLDAVNPIRENVHAVLLCAAVTWGVSQLPCLGCSFCTCTTMLEEGDQAKQEGNEDALEEFLEDLYGQRIIQERQEEPRISSEELLADLGRNESV